MKHLTNSCAVCSVSIGESYLMCGRHWRAVPKPLQEAVYVHYGRWQRHTGDKQDQASLIAEYRKARDAAVASARESSTLLATGDVK